MIVDILKTKSANKRQAIIRTNDGLIYRRKFVSLGLDRLINSARFEWNLRWVIFKLIFINWWLRYLCFWWKDECHWTLLMISQHWFRLVAWSSVGWDLCRYMASLGHNELTSTLLLWLCHLIQSQFLLPQTPLGPMSQSLPVLSEFVGKYHTIRHIEIHVCTISEDKFFCQRSGSKQTQ